MIYLKASGEKIRAARKAANLTQAQLGEKMHVSGSMIGQYETEVRRPTIKTAKEIAAILGIDARALFVEFEADDLQEVPAATITLAEVEKSKAEVIPADTRDRLECLTKEIQEMNAGIEKMAKIQRQYFIELRALIGSDVKTPAADQAELWKEYDRVLEEIEDFKKAALQQLGTAKLEEIMGHMRALSRDCSYSLAGEYAKLRRVSSPDNSSNPVSTADSATE